MAPRRFVVAERSMAPTLEPGDRVVARQAPVDVGDVVVATPPSGPKVVKRVVAIGPTEVAISDGIVSVGGTQSPWSPPGGIRGSGRWTVHDDEVFLLSDAAHRTDADSRTWGPIGTGSIVGVLGWRYRPLRRAGRIT